MEFGHEKNNVDYFNIQTVIYGILFISFIMIALRINRGIGGKYIRESMCECYIEILILVKLYWFRGRNPEANNELGNLSEITNRIGVRLDDSNPLYRMGMLKKYKSRKLRMSCFRFFYALQIQAMLQIVLLIVWMLIDYIKQNWMLASLNYWIFKGVFQSWILSGILAFFAVDFFYHHILQRERKQIFKQLLEENLFEKTKMKQVDEIIFDEIEKLPKKMEEKFGKFYQELRMDSKNKENEDTKIQIFEDRENYKTQILIQSNITFWNIDEIERLQKKIKEAVRLGIKKQELPIVFPCLTCVIYVEHMSDSFIKFMKEIKLYRDGFAILLAGVALDEKKVYIPETNDRVCKKMKNMIIDVLSEGADEEAVYYWL